MDIDTCVDVIEQIPANVIRIFVDYEVIAAVPAPVRAYRPIPRGDFKEEATRQPKAMVISIDADNFIAV